MIAAHIDQDQTPYVEPRETEGDTALYSIGWSIPAEAEHCDHSVPAPSAALCFPLRQDWPSKDELVSGAER
jgi:hypothetical protein